MRGASSCSSCSCEGGSLTQALAYSNRSLKACAYESQVLGWRVARWASVAGGRPRCAGREGSWAATSEEALARIRDVSHQIWRCLQIPVRVGDLAVAKVRRQSQHVLCDSVPAIRAGFQRPYCECVAKGMDCGSRKPHSTREADLLDDVVKCGFGVMQQQCAPPQGNEHVIIEWGIGAPL